MYNHTGQELVQNMIVRLLVFIVYKNDNKESKDDISPDSN